MTKGSTKAVIVPSPSSNQARVYKTERRCVLATLLHKHTVGEIYASVYDSLQKRCMQPAARFEPTNPRTVPGPAPKVTSLYNIGAPRSGRGKEENMVKQRRRTERERKEKEDRTPRKSSPSSAGNSESRELKIERMENTTQLDRHQQRNYDSYCVC